MHSPTLLNRTLIISACRVTALWRFGFAVALGFVAIGIGCGVENDLDGSGRMVERTGAIHTPGNPQSPDLSYQGASPTGGPIALPITGTAPIVGGGGGGGGNNQITLRLVDYNLYNIRRSTILASNNKAQLLIKLLNALKPDIFTGQEYLVWAEPKALTAGNLDSFLHNQTANSGLAAHFQNFTSRLALNSGAVGTSTGGTVTDCWDYRNDRFTYNAQSYRGVMNSMIRTRISFYDSQKGSGAELIVLNLHRSRFASGVPAYDFIRKEMVRLRNTPGGPLVVAIGDYNLEPSQLNLPQGYSRLPLRQWDSTKNDWAGDPFTLSDPSKHETIDHVAADDRLTFVQGGVGLRNTLTRSELRAISDHLPIWADIKLPLKKMGPPQAFSGCPYAP